MDLDFYDDLIYEWAEKLGNFGKKILENNFNSWEDLWFFSSLFTGFIALLISCVMVAHYRGHKQGYDEGWYAGEKYGIEQKVRVDVMNRAWAEAQNRAVSSTVLR